MSTARLRLVFAGTPDFAATHLQALMDSNRHDIVGVYTQPDRPAGRGKKATASAVKQLALAADLPVYQPLNFKDSADRQALAALQPDVMVVVAYGLILPQTVLDIPRLGCVNVHASLLPRWRGAAPIQRAIEAGDDETGVTIMQMDVGLDTGAMLLVERCPIHPDTTSASLYQTLETLGGPALLEALEQLANGQANPTAQDDQHSCYAAKIDKAEALINWQLSAQTLDRKIRAFNPFPCCYTELNGERLKIWQANIVGAEGPAGEIIAADRDGITVACGRGALCITQLQLPGGRAMGAAELLNSRAQQFAPGVRLGTP